MVDVCRRGGGEEHQVMGMCGRGRWKSVKRERCVWMEMECGIGVREEEKEVCGGRMWHRCGG